MNSKYDQLVIVNSAREDYVRDEEYECWLLNPLWKVMPSIAIFEDTGPVVLTCRDHNGGTKKRMIHPCRQPDHILPAKHADQIAHAIIQCRTIKPVKSTQYSTQYQMHEQRGTFNGIDTFGLTDFRRFDFTSKLSAESESRAIKNRPDINALLSQIVKEKGIAKCVANSRRQEAEDMCNGIDYSIYSQGATYVPFDVAMCLLQDINAKDTPVIVDDNVDNQQLLREHTRYIKKYWPSFIYPCQLMNGYGARFPPVPKFRAYRRSGVTDDDAMFGWTVTALLTRLEALWIITSKCRLVTSKWHGWMLVKLTKECFKDVCNKKQESKDPFKYIKVSSTSKMFTRLSYVNNDLEVLLSDLSKVLYLNFRDRTDYSDFERVNHDVHSVVIVDNVDIIQLGSLEFNIIVGGGDDDSDDDGDSEEGFEYELCFVSSTWHTANGWDSFVYSKHAGKNFGHWWYQKRGDALTRKLSDPPSIDNFVGETSLVLGYVCNEKGDTHDAKKEFLSYLGGKKNLFCHVHRTPLISSTERKIKCNCGKKEYYRCCTLECSCALCKSCADKLDPEVATFIRIANDDNEEILNNQNSDGQETDSDELESDGDESSLISPYDEENADLWLETEVEKEEDRYLTSDDFEDFVTRTEDPDIDVVDDDLEFDIAFPTTDAGEVPMFITNDEDQDKSAQHDNLHVSGHIVLNQCGTLLTRSKHQISGSSKHKFFLQKIHTTSPGNSMPLLYPENMIFPSIFYNSAGADQAGLGAIPAPLLTQSIEKYGFSSIPQHVRSRLTTPSCKYTILNDVFLLPFIRSDFSLTIVPISEMYISKH